MALARLTGAAPISPRLGDPDATGWAGSRPFESESRGRVLSLARGRHGAADLGFLRAVVLGEQTVERGRERVDAVGAVASCDEPHDAPAVDDVEGRHAGGAE